MFRMPEICCCLLVVMAAHPFFDADAQDAKPQKYIVVAANAPLKDRKKVIGTLQPGELLVLTQEQAGWLWAESRFGWVRKEHVVPLDRAVAVFTADIRKKPTAAGYHHRGLAYAALGKHNDAITDFTDALRLSPSDASLYNNRGSSWRSLGSRDNALRDFQSALKNDPNSAAAYNNRGLIQAELGKPNAALADFDRAVKLAPGFTAAYNNRGIAYRNLGRLKEALADYNRVLTMDPRFAEAYANRGYILKRSREYAKAIADYNMALKLSPQLATAHNDVAWLLATCPDAKLRDGKSAVRHATQACELTRYRDWNMLDTLSAAHAEAGSFAEAVRWATKAMEAAPANQKVALKKRIAEFAAKRPIRAK